jgi:hypothetical protein
MKKEKYTRTQVMLEPAQLKAIAAVAQIEKKSVSALLREWVDFGLRDRQHKDLKRAADVMADTYYSDGDLVGYAAGDTDDFRMKG